MFVEPAVGFPSCRAAPALILDYAVLHYIRLYDIISYYILISIFYDSPHCPPDGAAFCRPTVRRWFLRTRLPARQPDETRGFRDVVFEDVVFEDVVFDNNYYVTPY